MAISSYGKALASMAKESVVGSVKGFASNIKSAAISEMPALSGAVAFARSLRKEADKSNDEVKEEVKKQVKEQKFGNIIGLESSKFLKSINTNTAIQTRLLLQQSKFDRQNRMFAEEETRERLLRDKSLVDAIKKIGGGRGASTADGKSGGGVGSAISDLLGNVLGSVLSGAGLVGGGLLAGRALGLGRSRGATEILGTSKPNPRLSASKVGAIDVKAIGKKILPRLFGALFSGPVGAALIAYSLYELLSGIIGASSSAQGAQFPTSLGLPPNRRSGRQSTPPTSSTDDYLKKVIQVESGGRSNAQASTSSAYGLGQFTKGTFESLAANSPRDSAIYGKSFEDYKKNEELQIEALKALTEQNRTRFVRSGLPTDDASLYLAHFLGAGVAHKVLQSNNNIDLKSVIPTSYFIANPGVFGNLKTVGDLKAWAAKKMGMSGRSTAIPVASSKKETGAETRNRFLSALGNSSTTSNISNAGGGTALSTSVIPKVHDPIAEKAAIETNKFLKSISKSSNVTAKETRVVGNHYRPTRRIKTPQEKAQEHFEKSQENLLNTIDRTLTKFFGATLTDAIIPKGYGTGVTASQASATGFIGQTIGQATGIDKKVSSSLTKIFGKEYGQMLAPAVSGLGKAYVNKIGIELGTSLFAGTMGSNEAAAAITGQIVGNFAKDNKQMAMEQMLYAFTGVPSGPETIAAHYGFSSAGQAIKHIAEYGAATITNEIQSMTGMAGRPQRLPNMPMSAEIGNYAGMNPRGTNTLTRGAGYSSTSVLPGYGIRSTLDEGSAGEAEARAYMKNVQAKIKPEDVAKANESVIETSTKVDELGELTNAWGEEHEQVMYETNEADIRTQRDVGRDTVGAINNLGRSLASRPSGGTTIGGGSFGGDFSNFLMDMGTSFVVNKLTEKIKNPYVRAAANFAGQYAMRNYVTPTIAKSIGLSLPGAAGTAGSSTTMALQGGNIGSNIMSGFNTFQTMGPAYMTSNALASFAPSMYSIGSTIGGSALGSTFSQFGSGFTYGATPYAGAVGDALGNTTAFAAGQFGARVLPYSAAILQAFQGDIKGAATTAALTYIGTAIGGPIGGAIGSFIGSMLGGKKKRQPAHVFMERGIVIFGNSNIDAKFTINQNNPPEVYGALADQMLNVSFNLTKSLEIRTNKRSPFAVVYVMMHQNYIEVNLRNSENIVIDTKRWGAPHEVTIPTVVKETAVFIGEAFKKHLPAEAEKIEKGVSDLLKKSYRELVGGIEASVSRDLDKALSGAEPIDYQRSLQAQSMMAASGYKQPETEYTGGPQYDSEGYLINAQYDSDGNLINVGPRTLASHKVFDFRTGQMISSDVFSTPGNFDQRIIGVNHAGLPIYNVGSEQITAEDFLENLTKNPGAITPVTPAPGTIAPTLALRDDTDYRKTFLDSIGGVNTIVNTSNQTSSTTHVNNSSRSDADPFKVGTSIEAA